VLSGQAGAVPKFADGTVEMICQIKIARGTARKGRTATDRGCRMSAAATASAFIVWSTRDRITGPARKDEML
jgi:hypothetical protein